MLRFLGQKCQIVAMPLLGTGLLLVGLAGISGCAGVDRSFTGSGSETVTASDEPENHRRARIRLELASNYFESGQTQVALDEVKQALAANPAYADAYNLRGLIYMRLDDYEKAQESFRRALAINKGNSGILHNYAWLLCQQKNYEQADEQFEKVMGDPVYKYRTRTLMAQGVCQKRAGNNEKAESLLLQAYQLDSANPIVAYNLSNLAFERSDFQKAQFYVRRINNSELANAESLWLGIKVERALKNGVTQEQLASKLNKRFPDSRENAWYEKGAFDE